MTTDQALLSIKPFLIKKGWIKEAVFFQYVMTDIARSGKNLELQQWIVTGSTQFLKEWMEKYRKYSKTDLEHFNNWSALDSAIANIGVS